jgi:hypothetical protein
MARFTGLVGYVTQEESVPGVWSQSETPKMMKGDIIRQSITNGKGDRVADSGKVNDDVSLGHRVSLIGDAYAFANCFNMKWVQINGIKWSISSIEMQRPRIIVSLGGMWNA